MKNTSISGFVAVLSIIVCCSAAQAAEPTRLIGSNPGQDSSAALLNSVSSQLEGKLDINLTPEVETGDAQQAPFSKEGPAQNAEIDSLYPAQSQSQVARIER